MGSKQVWSVITPKQMIEIMWQLDHVMQARSKRMQKMIGITSPQRAVLRHIDARGPTSPKALAQAVHLHPSTLTGILQRLEAGRLITRKPHATDSRQALIGLTAAGKKLARRVPGSIETIIEKVFAQSTDEEAQCAYRVLGRLVVALE